MLPPCDLSDPRCNKIVSCSNRLSHGGANFWYCCLRSCRVIPIYFRFSLGSAVSFPPPSPPVRPFRLAASGNEDAVEALRALDSPTASSPPVGGEGGGAEGGGGGGGGGLTPLTVLPVLLALVGAGYCAVNDLIPRELSWAGGGGSGNSAAAGDTEDEDEPPSLSPLLRTLSRVAAFVPVSSSTTTPTPTSDDDDDDDDDVGGAPSPAEAAPIEEEQASEGQREEGWRLWGWWRRGGPGGAAAQTGEDLVGNSGTLPEDEVVTAGGGGEGLRHDEQQQRHPRWLRWRSSSPVPPDSPERSV